MFGADVTLEGGVFAEGLVAGGVIFAPETVLAFVDGLMAAETRRGQEAFSAIGPIAGEGALFLVRALDVLAKMFFFAVGLVAARFGAGKRAVVGVGSKMSGKSRGSVEGLVAAFVRTLDGLELGREFS